MEAAKKPSSRQDRAKIAVEQSGEVLTLRTGVREWFGIVFLAIWLVVWSGACISILTKTLVDPSMSKFLFAVPFLVGWLCGLAAFLALLVNRQTLEIDRTGAHYENRILLRLGRRDMPLAELLRAVPFVTRGDSESPSTRRLRIEGGQSNVDFGHNLSEKEQHSLVALVNEHLQSLGAYVAPLPVPELLVPGQSPVEAPADSALRLEHDFGAVRFVTRGEFSLKIIAIGLLATLGWDAVVGVFVFLLTNDFQWFLFCFLLPFEAVGLYLMACCLVVLTAPAWSLSWTFRPDTIVRRYEGFGLGINRYTDVVELARIELDADDSQQAPRYFPPRPTPLAAKYTLTFVGPAGAKLLGIRHLTEPEARWIADRVLREVPQWARSLEAPPSTMREPIA